MDFVIHNIKPVPKPRMTQRDKWGKRPCVVRYWQFKDEVQKAGVTIPDSGSHIIFIVPMPQSWSEKKKNKMRHQPHQVRPDVDNFLKSLFDGCFKEDSHIWDCRATKMWGDEGKIIVITGVQTDWIKGFLGDVL